MACPSRRSSTERPWPSIPGPHAFHFDLPDGTSLDQQVVVKEADHDLNVVATSKPVETVAVSGPPGDVASEPSSARPLKTVAFVLGGVGLAGIAAGSVFGVLTGSATSQQKNDCPSSASCPNHAQAQSDHSTAVTDGTISTVSFIAGGALLAGGIVLYVVARSSAAPATGLVVSPSVGPQGGGMTLLGTF